MARTLARISGVALRPGVSRNSRYYSPAAVASAVARAQSRLTEDGEPITMLTYHGAGDNSELIIGRVTRFDLASDGSATYEAELADTPHGRTILSLIDTNGDAPPFLRGVSIRGAWLGPVRTVDQEGRQCEAADDLEIVGLDLTKTPGVDGARIHAVIPVPADPNETAGERHLITESAEEASVTITEHTAPPASATAITPAAPVAEANTVTLWADRGYRGQPRWPLDTRAQARTAWVGLSESAGQYTPAQVKRMRGRVKAALERHGVRLTQEGWLIDPPTAVTETASGVAEGFWVDDDGGSFYVTVSNGRLSVNVSSYCVDPDDLDAVARAAMDGACKALAGMNIDPDAAADAAGSMEAAPDPAEPVDEATPASDSPAAEAAPESPVVETTAGTSTTEEAAVSEPSTQAAAAPTAAPIITLTDEQFGQLLGRLTPPAPVAAETPAETAPAASSTETAPPAAAAPAVETAPVAQLAETDEQRIDRIVAERVAAARTEIIQQVAQAYPPARRGLVGETATAVAGQASPSLPEGLPQKPLHQYTDDERAALDRYIATAVLPTSALTATSVDA